ncbi:LysR family transcriptional regulator [Cellulomonas sp. IC4_254]|uniref:LysR family transcriptional regulator n=1 Tax=Cellulomonas sp. IC4_254 TaxID=2714040 RepID=UPI0014230F7E|nr:LysR family transcriptional regulator [Cellulomonas sp. IC4_254]NHT16091.1 LysR family transcriptional regulator [Cellulomonas sp. IC4_254]
MTSHERPGAASTDLNLLRTFLAVYRAGSFTAAAARLGLAQPTVTTQVRALEQQTGATLFERLPRGVEPTPPAHDLAARLAAPLDALVAIGGGGLSGAGRPVRIAGPSELLCARVLPALADLVADGVELRVSQGLSEPLVEGLRSGAHDLVITTRRPRGRALRSSPLTDEEYVLVAAPAWAARLPAPPGPDDLRAVPLVTYADDLPIVRRYWRQVLGRVLDAPAALTVPNLHAVQAAVVAGAGCSVLPASLCADHLAEGRLVPLLTPPEPPLNTLFLVERPGADANPHVDLVRRRLEACARVW